MCVHAAPFVQDAPVLLTGTVLLAGVNRTFMLSNSNVTASTSAVKSGITLMLAHFGVALDSSSVAILMYSDTLLSSPCTVEVHCCDRAHTCCFRMLNTKS